MAYAIYIPPALLGLLVPMLLHPGLGPFQLLGSAQAPPPDRRCGPPASPLPQPTLERPSAQHPSPNAAHLPLFTDMSCVENLHGPQRLPCTGSPRSSSLDYVRPVSLTCLGPTYLSSRQTTSRAARPTKR